METYLILNGRELNMSVDEADQVILAVAFGTLGREELVEWIRKRIVPHRT